MTENDTGYAPPPPGFTPPPTPPPPAPRPALRRTTGDANVLGGVAAGIARSLGIDPILVRVTFVVLAIFGGSGIVLYLAGWVFIPEDGRAESAGERFFRDHNALAIGAGVVALVFIIGPMLAWGLWGDGPGFGGIVLLFLVIAGVVALTRRGGPPAQEPGPHVPADAPTSQPATAMGSAAPAPATSPAGPGSPTLALPSTPPPPPPAPREKSVLGRLTFGLTVLVAGTLIALDLGGVISVSAVTVLAVSLGVVSLGLLVGAFVGRSRGLIALGVTLVLVLVPLAALPTDVPWNTGAGVGERVYRVTSEQDLGSEYALGAGSLTLDLRRLEVTGPTSIDASVGLGELTVLLPPDLTVAADADVAVGTVTLPDEASVDGVDLARTWVQLGVPGAYPPGASLDLTLSAGLGEITIDTPQEVSR
jgi:phage shock protein PspC (stress-responsive transcriptional regulator)